MPFIASMADLTTSLPWVALFVADATSSLALAAETEVDFTVSTICSTAAAVCSSVAAWLSVRCDMSSDAWAISLVLEPISRAELATSPSV